VKAVDFSRIDPFVSVDLCPALEQVTYEEQNLMTVQEKSLYHQIHPLKLLIDIGATFPALYLFWQHQLVGALIATIIPSILASAFVMRFANLEPYKQSSMGRYIQEYMTPVVVSLRIIGLVVMCVGAWLQIFWLIPAGLAIVILAWMRGILFPLHVTT
jgi:hypothetical protein